VKVSLRCCMTLPTSWLSRAWGTEGEAWGVLVPSLLGGVPIAGGNEAAIAFLVGLDWTAFDDAPLMSWDHGGLLSIDMYSAKER